jgi:hypothetical protein
MAADTTVWETTLSPQSRGEALFSNGETRVAQYTQHPHGKHVLQGGVAAACAAAAALQHARSQHSAPAWLRRVPLVGDATPPPSDTDLAACATPPPGNPAACLRVGRAAAVELERRDELIRLQRDIRRSAAVLRTHGVDISALFHPAGPLHP